MIDLRTLFVNSRDWEGIVVHHSATKDGYVNDWAGIRKYHIIEKKWDDIGYHFGIEYTKNGVLVYRIGRSTDMTGGHTKGLNKTHLGICLVGNYDTQCPTDAQIFALTSLIKDIRVICPQIEKTGVIGHWEGYILLGEAKNKESAQAIKTCPGILFPIDKIRELV